MLSRRLFGVGAAGAALGAKQAAQEVIKQAGAPPAPPTQGTLIDGFKGKAVNELMSYDKAAALAKTTPWVLDLLTEDAWRQAREQVHHPIDIDILTKRAWSDSYKVHVQRERYVARNVANAFQGHETSAQYKLHNFINKLRFG